MSLARSVDWDYCETGISFLVSDIRDVRGPHAILGADLIGSKPPPQKVRRDWVLVF